MSQQKHAFAQKHGWAQVLECWVPVKMHLAVSKKCILPLAFRKLHCAIQDGTLEGICFGTTVFWGAEMRFAGAEKCIFVILTRSDFGVWALQGVSRLSLVWQGSGTESHGSLWALATGSRLAVDRARVRRICGFWKHCLHRAFSLARRPSAFSEPWQTHLLWERCVSLGTCSIAFCVAEIPPPRRFLCPPSPPLPSTLSPFLNYPSQ